jgi:5-methylcytosine-specific restriction endonuclease McrA
MHVEHIIPLAVGGSSTEDNLWLACPLCNGYKGTQTHYVDPVSDEQVPLFNPRQQIWNEHFRWSEDGTEIIGKTACGRSTVIALKLNNEYLVRARRRWVAVGWHPPQG